jgi:hypothetical protein
VLPLQTEDGGAVAQTVHNWFEYYRPSSPIAHTIVKICAQSDIMLDRCYTFLGTVLNGQGQEVFEAWHDSRNRIVAEAVALLPLESVRAVSILKNTSHGCRWLLEEWSQCQVGLLRYGYWPLELWREVVRLVGADPDLGEQTHLYVRRSPDLPNGVALVPATAPEEESEMAQDDLFPARRPSPMGLHRHAPEAEGAKLPHPVDASRRGEDHSLCEDPEHRQSLRSTVGAVPGSTVGLAIDPDTSRAQSDRGSLDETRGTMSGLWSTPATRRGGLPDPPSHLAEPRRP